MKLKLAVGLVAASIIAALVLAARPTNPPAVAPSPAGHGRAQAAAPVLPSLAGHRLGESLEKFLAREPKAKKDVQMSMDFSKGGALAQFYDFPGGTSRWDSAPEATAEFASLGLDWITVDVDQDPGSPNYIRIPKMVGLLRGRFGDPTDVSGIDSNDPVVTWDRSSFYARAVWAGDTCMIELMTHRGHVREEASEAAYEAAKKPPF